MHATAKVKKDSVTAICHNYGMHINLKAIDLMEAEKGNFYVSAVRRRTSAAKRTPSARSFDAELYTPPRRDKNSTPVTPFSAIN